VPNVLSKSRDRPSRRARRESRKEEGKRIDPEEGLVVFGFWVSRIPEVTIHIDPKSRGTAQRSEETH
jgi:hypothetical protein